MRRTKFINICLLRKEVWYCGDRLIPRTVEINSLTIIVLNFNQTFHLLRHCFLSLLYCLSTVFLGFTVEYNTKMFFFKVKCPWHHNYVSTMQYVSHLSYKVLHTNIKNYTSFSSWGTPSKKSLWQSWGQFSVSCTVWENKRFVTYQ